MTEVFLVVLVDVHPAWDQGAEIDSAWTDRAKADNRCKEIADRARSRAFEARVKAVALNQPLPCPASF
jgi:hypothetical protein